MPDVDLSGIFYRAYHPTVDEEEYEPLGPGDYPAHTGAIDLGVIKYRSWQIEFEDDEEEEE